MIDWRKRAEDALGITRIQNAPPEYRSSGTFDLLIRLNNQVPDIAAALAQAYGEGVGDGRASLRAKE